MEKTVNANFCKVPRVPVYSADNMDFTTPEKCIWMDVKLRALFPVKTWLRLFSGNEKLV
jgi:hypothetical protein